jgi:hypothetical protein
VERIPENIDYPWKIPENIYYPWKESLKILITRGKSSGKYLLPVERIPENIDYMANSLKNEIRQKCDL